MGCDDKVSNQSSSCVLKNEFYNAVDAAIDHSPDSLFIFKSIFDDADSVLVFPSYTSGELIRSRTGVENLELVNGYVNENESFVFFLKNSEILCYIRIDSLYNFPDLARNNYAIVDSFKLIPYVNGVRGSYIIPMDNTNTK
ncbi:MAG: hypothetical protein EX285_05695 [Thaumarchaeota archaeon]|nr:hypothetical protein [Nitrososphaerota archaeon]